MLYHKFDPSLLEQLIEESYESGDIESLASVSLALEAIDDQPLDELVTAVYQRNEFAQKIVTAIQEPKYC